jgi:hypothetical protein
MVLTEDHTWQGVDKFEDKSLQSLNLKTRKKEMVHMVSWILETWKA